MYDAQTIGATNIQWHIRLSEMWGIIRNFGTTLSMI